MSRKNRRMAPRSKSRWPQLSMSWRPGFKHAGIAVLIAGALIIAGNTVNHALSVQSWQIETPDPFLRQAINKALASMQPLNFLHSHPARLHDQLLVALPDLADIRIARHLPNRLDIVPVARFPVALLQQGETLKLVDNLGHAYESQRTGVVWDLPVLRVKQQHLPAAGRLLSQLREMDGNRFSKLSECRFLPPNSWDLYFEQGQRWLLEAKTAQKRMPELLAMLDKPQWQSRAWRVDARMDSRWFFRQVNKYGGAI